MEGGRLKGGRLIEVLLYFMVDFNPTLKGSHNGVVQLERFKTFKSHSFNPFLAVFMMLSVNRIGSHGSFVNIFFKF